VATAATLTLPIETRESDAQTDGGSADAATQTDAKAASGGKASAKDAAESDEQRQRALDMLQRVGPLMLREVRETGKTCGFFAGLERFRAEAEEKDISKLLTLKFDYDAFFQQQQQQADAGSNAKTSKSAAASTSLSLSCTGVSWNATGAVVAVAYGRFDHSGWCNYRSALCLWRVFQADFNPSRPHLVLEASVRVLVSPPPSLGALTSFTNAAVIFRADSCAWRATLRTRRSWPPGPSTVRSSSGTRSPRSTASCRPVSATTSTASPSPRSPGSSTLRPTSTT
jgi:hypothetical protein